MSCVFCGASLPEIIINSEERKRKNEDHGLMLLYTKHTYVYMRPYPRGIIHQRRPKWHSMCVSNTRRRGEEKKKEERRNIFLHNREEKSNK